MSLKTEGVPDLKCVLALELSNPTLVEEDPDAEQAATIKVSVDDIKEPILLIFPNNTDASAFLSEVAGDKIDEVFIGSCMANIG